MTSPVQRTEKDEAVTDDQAYLRLRAALARYGVSIAELDAAQRQEVDSLANQEGALQTRVLASEEARSVVLPENAVDGALDEIQQRYDSEEALQADLERNGLNERSLRVALGRELVAETVLERVGSHYDPVTDEEVRAYYESHPEQFEQPEMRTVRHILVTINPDYPENRPEQAWERLEAMRAEARQDPALFGPLAAKASECPSALHEGLVGKVPRGRLYPELDEELFRLGEGEIGGPVETAMGLHLVLCEAVYPGGTKPLEEVCEAIREHLEDQRRKRAIRTWLAEIPAPSGGVERNG